MRDEDGASGGLGVENIAALISVEAWEGGGVVLSDLQSDDSLGFIKVLSLQIIIINNNPLK